MTNSRKFQVYHEYHWTTACIKRATIRRTNNACWLAQIDEHFHLPGVLRAIHCDKWFIYIVFYNPHNNCFITSPILQLRKLRSFQGTKQLPRVTKLRKDEARNPSPNDLSLEPQFWSAQFLRLCHIHHFPWESLPIHVSQKASIPTGNDNSALTALRHTVLQEIRAETHHVWLQRLEESGKTSAPTLRHPKILQPTLSSAHRLFNWVLRLVAATSGKIIYQALAWMCTEPSQEPDSNICRSREPWKWQTHFTSWPNHPMFRHVSYWDSCTREKITLCSLSVTRSVETTQASIKKEQVIIMTKSFDGILHSSEKHEEVMYWYEEVS